VRNPPVLAWNPGDVVVGHGDAEMGDLAAAGVAQHETPGQRGQQQQSHSPAEPDERRNQHEYRDFHER
jgi:hypothetical protein